MIDLAAILLPLLFKVPQMVVIGFSLYYWSRKPGIDGILMSIGSVLVFSVSVFNTISPHFLLDRDLNYINIMTFTSAIGTLGSIAFAIGFGIIIAKMVKVKRHAALDNIAEV